MLKLAAFQIQFVVINVLVMVRIVSVVIQHLTIMIGFTVAFKRMKRVKFKVRKAK